MSDHSIDLHLLRLFVAVAEELHFGRAARRLRISQPPLSQQIRRLETLVGCPLFERTSRKVTLTAAGLELLEGAYQVLGTMRRAVERTRAAAEGADGSLEVGYVVPAMLSVLPPAIRRFRSENPRVVVHLRELSTSHQLTALSAGEIDVALVSGACPPGYRSCLEWTEPAVVLLPPSHPLAPRTVIEPAELSDQDFISFPRSQAPALHDAWVASCTAVGFVPRIVQEAQSWQMIAALVSAGLGIAIAPASAGSFLCRPGVPSLATEGELFRLSMCTGPAPSGHASVFAEIARLEHAAGPAQMGGAALGGIRIGG